MKNRNKLSVFALSALLCGATLTSCGNSTCDATSTNSASGTKTPFIKEVTILNEPETYYLAGETFDEGDFALQETYSDGSKKNVTFGYTFTRKTKSVLVDETNYKYEDQAVALTDPLTTNDDEIYITYTTTCQGYKLTYNLTQSLTVKDPSASDTEIFTVGTNDKIYFYGDGHVESYGIQYEPYAHGEYGAIVRNDGFWSWTGSELTIAMKNYNPNVSENADDEYRELILTKNSDGTYTFSFEWAAQSETVSSDPVTCKTYTYGGTIAENVMKKRLTANKTYGDQSLKGKYSKQTDIKK